MFTWKGSGMPHTFLFQPGVWSGAGTFWTEDGKALSAEIHTEISHRADCWLLAGSLRVLCSPHVEFVNNYFVEPPAPDALTTRFTSENSAIGKLKGSFSIVGPSIVSLYRCEGGPGYYGTEHLLQVDANHYEACGVLLLDGRRLSSWRVALRRHS
ncbi:MAG: hypothetical protein IRZ28_04240 [Steroidobacteraceae bacterium]|nr:hypothetical protein [Steroidobacteraceae bacterium]